MPTKNNDHYLGNPLIKAANTPVEFTPEQIEEYLKCSTDPIYFIENYIKIVQVDRGLIPFDMYDFQRNIVRTIHDNRFTICKLPRQSGKSTTMISYLLHHILFNQDKKVAILANKLTTARELLQRLKKSYENLPKWLQQGIVEWNKLSIHLENGSKVIASSTSSSAVRGDTYSCISGDSIITLRDSNGEIWQTTIEEVYLKHEPSWEVLTSKGFKRFHGVSKFTDRESIQLFFENGTQLKCTSDHLIHTNKGFKEAITLTSEDDICTDTSYTKLVEVRHFEKIDVYDLLEVEEIHSFYANGIDVHNCILLDEFAFVPNNIAEDFFNSVYPTISSGESTKVVIVSTPKGMNMFYKLWKNAENEKNSYVPIEVLWNEIPGRDQKFKEETIRNTSERQWMQEFECAFLGSEDTLISSAKLATMVFEDPVRSAADGLDIFEEPKKDNVYIMCVDTCRAQGADYHAFSVIDVTQMPYRMVAKYRNNTLPVLMYPTVIDKMGKYYNNAHILLEINDVGSEVADILYQELEYENVLLVSNRGKKGQKVDGGFGESGKVQFGVRISYQIKKLGCSILKEMIEQDKLMVTDLDVISELSTFISKGISHEASEGYHDDLVDTLVLFSWLTTQTYFREIIDIDTRKKLYEKRLQDLEASLSPFGFIEDGIVDFETEKARDASLLSRELPTQRSMDLPPEDVNLEDDSSFFWA
jgi:hypothetical protein